MIRGIERRRIFNDNEDRENLIERLSILIPKTKTQCYAWVFMPNHAHFLFRTGDTPLSALMRRVLTGYAISFNLRYQRHGQLFQNRYKSIKPIEGENRLWHIRTQHLCLLWSQCDNGQEETAMAGYGIRIVFLW